MNTQKRRGLVLCLVAAAVLPVSGRVTKAQPIRWNRVMGTDVGKLSSADKKRAAQLMRKIHCYYGCSDTVARCLVKDPKCQTARRLAGFIVRMVTLGRDDRYIRREVMMRAKSMHPFKKHNVVIHADHCTSNPAKAKVVIAAFSEFQCPFCTIILPWLRKIVPQFGLNVALCYKHFPTSVHGKTAVLSSQAAVAAARQGKFWPMHDILYKNRKRQAPDHLVEYAQKLGLNMAKWRADRDSRSTRKLVALDKREGLRLGVKGTPTLFINGKRYHGRKDRAELTDRIAEELHLKSGGR